MSPIFNTTVKETMFPHVVIKVEPNLYKRNLRHGDRPDRDDNLDVIFISSDLESRRKSRKRTLE
jgi:hypothetical protein